MIEVLKQAAEDVSKAYDVLAFAHTERALELLAKTRTSLRQAIAELESQEPVALPCCGYTDASAVKWNPLNGVVQCHNCGQTYTHPPQRTEPVSDDIASIIACRDMLDAQPVQRTWVGLTEEDRAEILSRKWWDFEDEFDVDGFLRLAEAKLKEKNT